MNDSLCIISWNVNGIRAVSEKNGFEWLEEYRPDILCLQEIKAAPQQLPEDLFSGRYPHISVNSGERKGYSGTLTAGVMEPYCSDICGDIDILNEGRVIEHHYGDVVLFNVYFPNGQKDEERLAYKLEFYDKFLHYTQHLRSKGKKIIICGDVNTAHREIDLKNPKSNEKTSGFLPIERAWIDKLIESGYIDTFRHVHGDKINEYSWWSYRFSARSKNVGWRIDYFFISEELLEDLEDAFILQDVMGSDHCPVGIKIRI